MILGRLKRTIFPFREVRRIRREKPLALESVQVLEFMAPWVIDVLLFGLLSGRRSFRGQHTKRKIKYAKLSAVRDQKRKTNHDNEQA